MFNLLSAPEGFMWRGRASLFSYIYYSWWRGGEEGVEWESAMILKMKNLYLLLLNFNLRYMPTPILHGHSSLAGYVCWN